MQDQPREFDAAAFAHHPDSRRQEDWRERLRWQCERALHKQAQRTGQDVRVLRAPFEAGWSAAINQVLGETNEAINETRNALKALRRAGDNLRYVLRVPTLVDESEP